MVEYQFSLRKASMADAEALARVFSPSLRLLTFLPILHDEAEDLWFLKNVILQNCEVMVVEAEGEIISFLAREDEEIKLLHSHPRQIGKGAGSLLLKQAKEEGPGRLELWCFQANWAARRFYERHGFVAVTFTDGQRNEEKTPDLLYRWQRN